METSQFPPNGALPPVQPYTGAPIMNGQNHRRDAYPQQQMMNGGQHAYMFPPGPPPNGHAMQGMPPQQGQYQQQRHQLPPQTQLSQQIQQQNGQPLKQEQQDQSPGAMIGRTPTASAAPTALVPLDKTAEGESPADELAKSGASAAPKEPASHSMIELGRRYTLQVVQQPVRARMCGFGDKVKTPMRRTAKHPADSCRIAVQSLLHHAFVLLL